MKNIMRYTMYMILALCMMTATSSAANANPTEKQAIFSQFRAMKATLPQTINAGVAITDVNIRNNNTIELTCQLSKEYLQNGTISASTIQSDRNLARAISNFDDDMISGLTRNGLNLKYIYTSEITGRKIAEVTLTPQKIADIKRRVKNGTLKPYTTLDLTKMELSRMTFPQKICDGAWITSGYVKGHNLFYTLKFEADIDSSAFSYELLQQMKQECVADLRNDNIFQLYKEDISRENIHIIYIMQNGSGEEIARVDISPSDIYHIGTTTTPSTDNRYVNL